MSSGVVLSFLRRPSYQCDWSQQELAEFYRVESALLQGGLSVTTDRGVSDEGDPWFVFCRVDNEDVIAHFARIDQEYVVVSNLHASPVRHSDFRRLIREVIEAHPMMLPMKRSQGQKLFIHPAALLTALLASAYFFSSEKELAGTSAPSESGARHNVSLVAEKFAVIAAAGLAVVWIEHQVESLLKLFENNGPAHGAVVADNKAPATETDGSVQSDLAQANAQELHKDVASKPNANLLSADDATSHVVVVPQQLANNSTGSASVGPDDNGAGGPVTAPDHGFPGQFESPSGGNDGSSTTAPGTGVSMVVASASQSLASADQGSSDAGHSSSSDGLPVVSDVNAAGSDAFRVASLEIGTAGGTVQPITLSVGPATLHSALLQAFAQAGYDADAASPTTDSTDVTTDVVSQPGSNSPISDVSAAILSSPTSLLKLAETMPAAPDSQIERSLNAFLQNTPSVEVDVVGSHLIIIDTNPADTKSADFGIETWQMSDGSTLSIVGIIPHHHAASAAA
jgi:hypothetical protein